MLDLRQIEHMKLKKKSDPPLAAVVYLHIDHVQILVLQLGFNNVLVTNCGMKLKTSWRSELSYPSP